MFLRLVVLVSIILAAAPMAVAKKVALVIGNDQYVEVPVLQKAVNDARAIRDVLQADMKFDTVIFGENLDQRTMNRKINEFEDAIETGDTAFFYFSGHGVALGAENYLTPIDVQKPEAGEENILAGRSFGADALTQRIEAKGAKAIFAVLDACRDNPFKVEGTKALAGAKGLQRMDAAEGVFVLFAAGIGQTALDRLSDDDDNPNSVFTRSLIPLLKTPGLSQVDIAKAVQQDVAGIAAKIDHKQVPAYYDQIRGVVTLNDNPVQVSLQPTLDDGNSSSKSDLEVAPSVADLATDWARAQNSNDAAVINAFIDNHAANQDYVNKAKRLLTALAMMVPEDAGATNCKLKTTVAGKKTCVASGKVFLDCAICPQMVVVPAGSFLMGQGKGDDESFTYEAPQHKVKFAKAFAVGKFEITREQFSDFVSASGYRVASWCILPGSFREEKKEGKNFLDPGFVQTDDHPAVCVSYDDAQAYVKWLSEKTGQHYRLLSESEWEYAGRAGTTTRYVTGEGIGQSSANFNNNNKGTVSVGTYPLNDFGLADMTGNAAEWVEDCYVDNYKTAPKDGTPKMGFGLCPRITRGGGWYYTESQLRASSRSGGYDYATPVNYVGFRIARGL